MTIRSTRSILVAAAGAVLALAPALAHAASVVSKTAKPAQAWNQAAVTAIAQELAKSCDKLYDSFWNQPGDLTATGDDSDQFRIQYKLQTIQFATRGLADELAKGQGRKQTLPQYEDIGELARDLAVLLERSFQTHPVLARVKAAAQIWKKLTPYYGVPESLQP